MEFYAHLNKDQKELLIDHLKKTGKLAEQFSSEFGYGKLGLQLGLLHDVGKHTERFQKVLQRQLKKIDHAVVSAECYADLADQSICDDDFIYLMICNCLNAHHSILRDLTASIHCRIIMIWHLQTTEESRMPFRARKSIKRFLILSKKTI